MRKQYREKLDNISNQLIEMGSLMEQAIDNSIAALYEDEQDKAHLAIQLEEEIDKKEREIENLCFNIIMMEQPVAGDLRLISAAIKMITDMERIGDQAADIAEIALSLESSSEKHMPKLQEMTKEAVKMVKNSIDSFVALDLEMAEQVIENDDVVDNYFLEIRGDLVNSIKQDSQNAGNFMDLFMVAKYLERIADHACNIAQWVIFAITGVHEDENKHKND